MVEDGRAASSVVGVVLTVGVVVVLAAVVAVSAFAFGQSLTDPAPTVAQSSGSLEPNDGGNDAGLLRLTHRGGDTVRTADVEIVVDATDACGARTRLVDLPVDGYSGNAIDDGQNVDGADILDNRPPYFGGPSYSAIHGSEFAAGDEILLRIPDAECAVREGDAIDIVVVHAPTNSVLIETTLTAS